MVPNRGASWAKCYWVKKYELWCGSAGTDRGESCLWLVVRHLLDQWLTGELLRAAGEVLGRVSGALCYNRWSCCRCWMHHGGRARRVVLVWPLLGHVGYWRGIHEEAEEKRFKFYIQTLHWSMMKKLETEKLMFFCCCFLKVKGYLPYWPKYQITPTLYQQLFLDFRETPEILVMQK